MDKFMKMLENKAKVAKPMSDVEKQAKIGVIKDMRSMAQSEMGAPLKGLKKVSVTADSPEGLEAGLEKAEGIVEGKDGEMSLGSDDLTPSADLLGDEPLSVDEIDEQIQELLKMKEMLESKKV